LEVVVVKRKVWIDPQLLSQKELEALGTLVFETLGQPEKAREYSIKLLKRLGIDILYGMKGGELTYFSAPTADKRVAGSVYTDEEGVTYEVKEVVEKLPEGKKLMARIEGYHGTAYLVVDLITEDENLEETSIEVVRTPAASLMLAFFKKNKWPNLIEAFSEVGVTTVFRKSRGQGGKPHTYDMLPNVVRRFLREARKLEKRIGFGRISFAYFGEDKEENPRYRMEWMLPTTALFDMNVAEKADKILALLK
jgi:uncharacterized protein (TIGR00703 family)